MAEVVAITVTEPPQRSILIQEEVAPPINVGGYGPPGPAGPQGSPGRDGGGAMEFVYTQSVAAPLVIISHTLNRSPAGITVYDGDGYEVDVGIRVIDPNTIEVEMEPALAIPFTAVLI